MSKGKFIVTVGAPGSGKSTWADSITDSDTLRLERDRFRIALFGSQKAYWNQTEVFNGNRQRHRDLSALVGATMARAMDVALDLRTHKNVLLSDTASVWTQVMNFHKRAVAKGLKMEVHVFDVPWDIIFERNETRDPDKKAHADFLRDTFDKVNDPHAWWRREKNLFFHDQFGRIK